MNEEKRLDEKELEEVSGGISEDAQKMATFLQNNCHLCDTMLFCHFGTKFIELGRDPNAHCPSFVPKK